MNNYYASEYTLQQINDNLIDFNNNFLSIMQSQYVVLIVIALIFCVYIVDKFVDKCLNSRG